MTVRTSAVRTAAVDAWEATTPGDRVLIGIATLLITLNLVGTDWSSALSGAVVVGLYVLLLMARSTIRDLRSQLDEAHTFLNDLAALADAKGGDVHVTVKRTPPLTLNGDRP